MIDDVQYGDYPSLAMTKTFQLLFASALLVGSASAATALSFATSGRRRPSEALYRALEEATGKPRELLWPEAFSGKGASS